MLSEAVSEGSRPAVGFWWKSWRKVRETSRRAGWATNRKRKLVSKSSKVEKDEPAHLLPLAAAWTNKAQTLAGYPPESPLPDS